MSDDVPPLTSEQAAELRRLTAVFERIGVADPEGWARFEVVTGTPQAAGAMLLRVVWRHAIDYFRDSRWLDEISELHRRDQYPFSDAGAAMERMREAGINDADVKAVARAAAAQAVFNLLYSLEDYEPIEGVPGWRLIETDAETGHLTGRELRGLYESLLDTDPSGRDRGPR